MPGTDIVQANYYANQARYMLNYGAGLRTHRLKVTNVPSAFARARRSAFNRANYTTFKLGKYTRPTAFKFRKAAYRAQFYVSKYGYRLEHGLQGVNMAIKYHPGRTRAVVYGAAAAGLAYHHFVAVPKRRRSAAAAGFKTTTIRRQRIVLPGHKTTKIYRSPSGKQYGHLPSKRAIRKAGRYQNTPPQLSRAQRQQMARRRRRVKGRFA